MPLAEVTISGQCQGSSLHPPNGRARRDVPRPQGAAHRAPSWACGRPRHTRAHVPLRAQGYTQLGTCSFQGSGERLSETLCVARACGRACFTG